MKLIFVLFIEIKEQKKKKKNMIKVNFKSMRLKNYLIILTVIGFLLFYFNLYEIIAGSMIYSYREISRKLEVMRYYDAHIHTIQLLGSFELGYYYINLFVGEPPQKQSVIVDTGSSITAFPCYGIYFKVKEYCVSKVTNIVNYI